MRTARCASGSPAVLLLLARAALAQFVLFDKEPLVEPKSLQTVHAFYAYAEQDAPEATLGPAVIRFHRLRLHLEKKALDEGGIHQWEEYQGVQVTLLRYAEFWHLIDPNRFCCSHEDFKSGKCKKQDQLEFKTSLADVLDVDETPGLTHSEVEQFVHRKGHYTHGHGDQLVEDRRRLAEQKAKRANASIFTYTVGLLDEGFRDHHVMTVHTSGVYILIVSNCGGLTSSRATLSGAISLRNPYGYLPGNEYYKMPFYSQLLMAYALLLSLWGASLLWWRAELFQIQHCITAVLILSLLDALTWYALLCVWNFYGSRGGFLVVVATFLHVLKRISTYMFLLVASYGWGVTRKQLGHGLTRRFLAIGALWIMLDLICELVLMERHAHMVSTAFIILVACPLLVLNLGMIIAILRALWRSIRSSREQQDFDRLLFFQRLRGVLIVSLVAGMVALAFQMLLMSGSMTWRWKVQWFASDAIPGLLFLVNHVSLVYLWRPNRYSQIGNSRESSVSLLPMSRGENDWGRLQPDEGEGAPLVFQSLEHFLEPMVESQAHPLSHTMQPAQSIRLPQPEATQSRQPRQPQAARLELTRLEAMPKAVGPEDAEPGAMRQEARQPKVAQPEALRSGLALETVQPEVMLPDMTQQEDPPQPEVAQPASQSDAPPQQDVQSAASLSHAAQQELAQTAATEPESTQPENSHLEELAQAAQPGTEQPDMQQEVLAQQELAQPEVQHKLQKQVQQEMQHVQPDELVLSAAVQSRKAAPEDPLGQEDQQDVARPDDAEPEEMAQSTAIGPEARLPENAQLQLLSQPEEPVHAEVSLSEAVQSEEATPKEPVQQEEQHGVAQPDHAQPEEVPQPAATELEAMQPEHSHLEQLAQLGQSAQPVEPALPSSGPPESVRQEVLVQQEVVQPTGSDYR